MTKRFTGWHMTAIMIAFFGTVVAVNLLMATFATRTFGGTIVDNSYVAGQKFNGWLEEARSQERLGWSAELGLDRRRHIVLAVSDGDLPLKAFTATGVARHPLGREPDIAFTFRSAGPGLLRADGPLPQGRWLVHVEIRRGSDRSRLIKQVS